MNSLIQDTTVSKKDGDQTALILAMTRNYLTLGQVHKAAEVLLENHVAHFEFNLDHEKFALISTMGEVYLNQGKLHLAAATYQPLLDLVAEHPVDPDLFHFYNGLCHLYYEWNYLEKARQYLQWCLEKIKQAEFPSTVLLVNYLSLTWVLWADGWDQAANEAVQQAVTIAQRTADPGAIQQAKAHQARLWLRRGKLKAAAAWAKECGLRVSDAVMHNHQFEYLTLARVLIRQHHAGKALALLDQLRQAAMESGRGSNLIEILALKALAYQDQGDLVQALAELAQALCRAEREGYIRTFLDEGAPMADLLNRIVAWGVTLAYVKELLVIFAHSAQKEQVMRQRDVIVPDDSIAFLEPLTKRELEVLRLVTSGNSNEDVARTLNIAPTTAKKHLGNILSKLAAKNRTQAVAKARALALV